MTDENLDLLFDESDEAFANDGGGTSGDSSNYGVRSIEDFRALVEYHIAVLSSVKNNPKLRVESALWLGESGEIDAIRPLIAVYKRDKKNPKVQKAAAYALGMFKALDSAIYREPGEMIEDALDRPENADIIQALTDIAVLDKRGARSGGRRWLRMMFILLVILVALLTAYTLVPQGTLTEILTPPTATPTPTIDPNAPTPTPTFTPSHPPTITPTPTNTPGIPPEEARTIQSDLFTYVSLANTTRGFLESLTSAWTTIAQGNADSIRTVCSSTQIPTIPDDYVLPAGYAELNPAFGQATDYINTGLALTRSGWAFFTDSCAAGVTPDRINTALSIIRTAQDSFAEADSLLTQP